jgi:hypothetical protein
MARVFVVNQPIDHFSGNPKMDLRPATQFGKLVFLTPPGGPYVDGDDVTPWIQRHLQDFDAENDYILPVGAPQFLAVTGMLLGRMGVTGINMLIWHRGSRQYMAERYDLPPVGAARQPEPVR